MELGLLKRKLARGSLAGLVRVALAVPLYLILTPFVLHSLGAEMFGLWSFGTLVVSVMTLTDFGFKNALVYHVANRLDEHERVTRYFNVTLMTYFAMSLLVVMTTLFAGDAIVTHLLHVPESLRDEAAFVLWVTALSFALRFLSIPYQALAEAHQEHATVQMVMLFWLLFNFAGTLIALSLQADIYALGVVSVLANGLVLLLLWAYVRYKHSFIRVNPLLVGGHEIKSMLGYGSGVQIATLLIAAREPLLKVMIARAYDLASVATFEIVYKLCTQLVSLVMAPLLGSFSAAALLAKERVHELEQVLRPMYGFCIAMFIPALLFMASFAQSLVELWLGPGYQGVSAILPLAFTSFAIYYTTEILYKAIEASGLSWYSALIQSLSLAMTVGAFFLFSDSAAMAVPASLFAGFVTFSLFNLLVFRWRFPAVELCTARQWLWLIAPASIYLGAGYAVPRILIPVLFVLYLFIHFYCASRAGVFNLFGMARKLASVVLVRT